MRSCDREDLAQEKLLAELEGRKFSLLAFRAKYTPREEVSYGADPEIAAHRPVLLKTTFQTEGANYRDEKLRTQIQTWCAGGASLRWIARELTRLRVPKFKIGSEGRAWTWVGVYYMLKRLGIKTLSKVGWRRASGPFKTKWVHWTQRPEHREKLLAVSAAGCAARWNKGASSPPLSVAEGADAAAADATGGARGG